jgi:DNA-binding beta-propeller fold protein YncE
MPAAEPLWSDTHKVTTPANTEAIDTIPATPVLPSYTELRYTKTEVVKAAPGTKSVLFNSTGTQLFAMNLEGMSIYQFDRSSRSVTREFKFKPTRGTGWDYETDKPIPSYEEKPVEACLSHDDKWLWVSLHNAEGIIPIRVDSLPANKHTGQVIAASAAMKKITVIERGSTRRDSFQVPLIRTGKTPKVIARTGNSSHLLVSNWHSYNVSVLSTHPERFPYATVTDTIPVPAIPRGIVVDDRNQRSFVAIMGGASLMSVNNNVWMKEKDLTVASNPRHIVIDSSGRLFVSYNRLGKIACIDPNTGETLFTATTAAQPRTIILSKNHRFLFVTCYSSDKLEVFRINDDSFTRIASLPCPGHPVGVDIYENESKLEAWVCSYTTGKINVFNFEKNKMIE